MRASNSVDSHTPLSRLQNTHHVNICSICLYVLVPLGKEMKISSLEKTMASTLFGRNIQTFCMREVTSIHEFLG